MLRRKLSDHPKRLRCLPLDIDNAQLYSERQDGLLKARAGTLAREAVGLRGGKGVFTRVFVPEFDFSVRRPFRATSRHYWVIQTTSCSSIDDLLGTQSRETIATITTRDEFAGHERIH